MRLLSLPVLGRLLTRLQPPSPRQVQQLARKVGQHPLAPEVVELLVATARPPAFRQRSLAELQAELQVKRGGHAPWLSDPAPIGARVAAFGQRTAR